MIVRILGRGQFRLTDEQIAAANEIDDRVQAAADSGDDSEFHDQLTQLVAYILANGQELPAEEFVGSDAVLPNLDTTLEEAKDLLAPDGLIPG